MVRKYLDLELLYSFLTVPFVLFITCETRNDVYKLLKFKSPSTYEILCKHKVLYKYNILKL